MTSLTFFSNSLVFLILLLGHCATAVPGPPSPLLFSSETPQERDVVKSSPLRNIQSKRHFLDSEKTTLKPIISSLPPDPTFWDSRVPVQLPNFSEFTSENIPQNMQFPVPSSNALPATTPHWNYATLLHQPRPDMSKIKEHQSGANHLSVTMEHKEAQRKLQGSSLARLDIMNDKRKVEKVEHRNERQESPTSSKQDLKRKLSSNSIEDAEHSSGIMVVKKSWGESQKNIPFRKRLKFEGPPKQPKLPQSVQTTPTFMSNPAVQPPHVASPQVGSQVTSTVSPSKLHLSKILVIDKEKDIPSMLNKDSSETTAAPGVIILREPITTPMSNSMSIPPSRFAFKNTGLTSDEKKSGAIAKDEKGEKVPTFLTDIPVVQLKPKTDIPVAQLKLKMDILPLRQNSPLTNIPVMQSQPASTLDSTSPKVVLDLIMSITAKEAYRAFFKLISSPLALTCSPKDQFDTVVEMMQKTFASNPPARRLALPVDMTEVALKVFIRCFLPNPTIPSTVRSNEVYKLVQIPRQAVHYVYQHMHQPRDEKVLLWLFNKQRLVTPDDKRRTITKKEEMDALWHESRLADFFFVNVLNYHQVLVWILLLQQQPSNNDIVMDKWRCGIFRWVFSHVLVAKKANEVIGDFKAIEYNKAKNISMLESEQAIALVNQHRPFFTMTTCVDPICAIEVYKGQKFMVMKEDIKVAMHLKLFVNVRALYSLMDNSGMKGLTKQDHEELVKHAVVLNPKLAQAMREWGGNVFGF